MIIRCLAQTHCSVIMASVLLFCGFATMTLGQVVIHSHPTLPRSDGYMAIGYYNQSIYLLYAVSVFVCSDEAIHLLAFIVFYDNQ